jgi:hypothetical protein
MIPPPIFSPRPLSSFSFSRVGKSFCTIRFLVLCCSLFLSSWKLYIRVSIGKRKWIYKYIAFLYFYIPNSFLKIIFPLSKAYEKFIEQIESLRDYSKPQFIEPNQAIIHKISCLKNVYFTFFSFKNFFIQ